MGRRAIDTEILRAAKADLTIATKALEAVRVNLAQGMGKVAQDDEPPAEDAAEVGGDLGDEFDEGTTGEEGGEDLEGEDLGDLGDLEGDMGGGGFGGGGGGGAGGDFGEDAAPEGGDADGTAQVEADVTTLQTEVDAIKRTIVNISETLRGIRNPLGDPAKGNDAMQSV